MVFLFFAFFTIALVYSLVGFGGGSLYLALLSNYGFSQMELKFLALQCNVIVTCIGSFLAWRQRYIPRSGLALLLVSAPACFVSAWFPVSDRVFMLCLACGLGIAGILMIIQEVVKKTNDHSIHTMVIRPWHWIVSAIIGFFSGITGIGGGVYLSPIFNITRTGDAKSIAALSSVFIFINSIVIASVIVINHGLPLGNATLWRLPLAVALGGLIGAGIGYRKMRFTAIRFVTATLLIFASARIFWQWL